jgi:hypothetical protein
VRCRAPVTAANAVEIVYMLHLIVCNKHYVKYAMNVILFPASKYSTSRGDRVNKT